jgi:hypothetical protein
MFMRVLSILSTMFGVTRAMGMRVLMGVAIRMGVLMIVCIFLFLCRRRIFGRNSLIKNLHTQALQCSREFRYIALLTIKINMQAARGGDVCG